MKNNINQYIDQYIKKIDERYQDRDSTESSYRPYLIYLLDKIFPDTKTIDEIPFTPRIRLDLCTKKNDIPKGYIETKKVGEDLGKLHASDQFKKYKKNIGNLIFTDFMRFQLFQNEEDMGEVEIAKVVNKEVVPIKENYEAFTEFLRGYYSFDGALIKSAEALAERMAIHTKKIQNKILTILEEDINNGKKSYIHNHYQSFKKALIHDLSLKQFSDIYAQTISYGMFTAHLHTPEAKKISLNEMAQLIPKSNPLLRRFLHDLMGLEIEEKIKQPVNRLVKIFQATHLNKNPEKDPVIHFYETFLKYYDPEIRKKRGVWYTPSPIVKFMVESVDHLLKTAFNINEGIADSTKIECGTEEVHKVQILDPAAGTGTFMVEVAKHIHNYIKENKGEGMWNAYVDENLIPRLNGFEILMTPYTIAHLSLSVFLKKTGYAPEKAKRFQIYLTNSLEEINIEDNLFIPWISEEGRQANKIKNKTPIMVVMGNPPYSIESSNNGKWIMGKTEDYKSGLNERNKKPLNDDYVKFIRCGQDYIEKKGSGILAFINNRGFIDNLTFRKMRSHLLKTFDKIYIIDLHGDSRKKETAPDGSPDKNVFDIQTGVSINFFVKTRELHPNELGKVYHYDLYGKREDKFDFLLNNTFEDIHFKRIPHEPPNFFMNPRTYALETEYEKGFGLNALFSKKNVGIITKKDHFTINFSKEILIEKIKDFVTLDEKNAREKYNLGKDSRDWKVLNAQRDLTPFKRENIKKIAFRPFDLRYTYYTGKSNGFLSDPRKKIMQHLLHGNNIGLIFCRIGENNATFVHLIKNISDLDFLGARIYIAPLYIKEKDDPVLNKEGEWVLNMNREIIKAIEITLGLKFTEEENQKDTFTPKNIVDYIYAVLHTPTYQEKYAEFLRTNYPRVPYPYNREKFWKLAHYGRQLRKCHLLEDTLSTEGVKFQGQGDNKITRIVSKDCILDNGRIKVWINETQYFDSIPKTAWEHYIGNHQPAQKWLKDRKKYNYTLSTDDCNDYMNIIKALSLSATIIEKLREIV